MQLRNMLGQQLAGGCVDGRNSVSKMTSGNAEGQLDKQHFENEGFRRDNKSPEDHQEASCVD